MDGVGSKFCHELLLPELRQYGLARLPTTNDVIACDYLAKDYENAPLSVRIWARRQVEAHRHAPANVLNEDFVVTPSCNESGVVLTT